MRRLDCVLEATGMSLAKLREAVEDRRAWHALVHGVMKSQTEQQQLGTEFPTRKTVPVAVALHALRCDELPSDSHK